MNTEPFENYFKSIDAYREGKTEQAEKLLADSLGLLQLTDYLKSSLPVLLNKEKVNPVILGLLIHETMKEA